MVKFGHVESTDRGRELWMNFLEDQDDPSTIYRSKVLTWTYGETNLVVTIPHAGTIGSDTTAAGNLYCESGNVIHTRIGTNQHPIRTYARDAATDIIGHQLANRLGDVGLRPHIIECHVHRSKVECNRSIEEVAVDKLGEEAQEILDTYHAWTKEALEECKRLPGYVPGVFLVDLHGHGHPHEYIELGYRITADVLNAIQDEENSKATWNNIMTSSSRNEFTLRHLVSRKFGLDNVDAALIGPESFAACMHRELVKYPELADLKCIPSEDRPCPGKLGYYIGAHTVRQHAKLKRVDCVQIELPLSVRTGADTARDYISQVLGDTLLEFYNLHYRVTDDSSAANESSGESELEDTVVQTPPPAPAGPPPPPLPPPPPPPPAIANARQGDGISHMTMMAKSKMHEELVSKAKSRQSNIEEMIMETSTTTTSTEINNSLVSNKVSDIEHKLEMMANNDKPVENGTGTSNGTGNGHSKENGDGNTVVDAARQKPVQKPKLYDSLFADRKLPEKELKRRQFLFGIPAPQPRPKPEKKPAEEPKQTVVDAKEPEKPAPPAPAVQPKPEPSQNDKKDKKSEKGKKKCCTIL